MKRAPRKAIRRLPSQVRRSRIDELIEDGSPDEAVAFIVEILPGLTRLARVHDIDLLAHLLGMTLMEAEEYLRVRSKRKLS